jgi:CBS domain-containing protein
MGPVPAATPTHTLLPEVVTKLGSSDLETLPLIDADGRYRGVITTRQLERALAETRSALSSGNLPSNRRRSRSANR